MKHKLIALLGRWGMRNLSQGQISVAFVLWLFPMGTLWLAIYLMALKMFRQTRVLGGR